MLSDRPTATEPVGDDTWLSLGSCIGKDPQLFFPTDSRGVRIAQIVCSTCAVKSDCLNYALDHKISYGVWGGVSERGRRRLGRARALRV
jgi:WhiB family redox-sensing transcriptional regulator